MTGRVLILTPYGTTGGGAEQWLLGILRERTLQRAGWAIDAVVMQGGPFRTALLDAGVTAATVNVPASPLGILRHSPKLSAAIRARRPDVVVCNGVKAQLAATLAMPVRTPPTVWVKHDHSYDRALARVLAARATAVVATAWEVGLPTHRQDLVVIEPPRPPDPLPPETAKEILRQRGWRRTRALTLMMVSRLVPYKGVDLAIAALSDPRCEQWELVVIGGDDPATPDESTRLRQLAQASAVSQRVFLTGAIPQAGRLLSAADAVAVLTRPGQPGAPGKEGYGIVASEAMLAGVPVIVAQPGPITRRIETPTGPAGITLAVPDSTHVAQALSTLTDDRVRHQMGADGITAARALPSQSDVAEDFLGVLERVRG